MIQSESRNHSAERMRVVSTEQATIETGGPLSSAATPLRDHQKKGRPPAGPGVNPGAGRFRTRSRTPLQPHMNTIQAGKRASLGDALFSPETSKPAAFAGQMTKTIDATENRQPGMASQNSVSNFRGGRSVHHIRTAPQGPLSNRFTVGSTSNAAASNASATIIKTSAPGPGSYDYQPMFPKGPKFIVQKKTRRDSLIQTKIS